MIGNNDHLLQKMQLKEQNHMDTTEETCELLSKVFDKDPAITTETHAQEKAKEIIGACMKSADWMENTSALVGSCKNCISNLLQCLSSDTENEFLHRSFIYHTDVYVEISSTLISILMNNTHECLNPPTDFPEELSSDPFSEDISVQFSQTISLLTQIQKYANNKDTDALAYCLPILFTADLHNMHMCDEQEKKYQAT